MAVETVRSIRHERLTSTATHTLSAQCQSVLFQSLTAANTIKFKTGGTNVLTLTIGIPYVFSSDDLKGLPVDVTISSGAVEIVEFCNKVQ